MHLERVLQYSKTLIEKSTSNGDITIDATVGNGNDTFPFFDDFGGGSLDGSKWNVTYGQEDDDFSVEDGMIKFLDSSDERAALRTYDNASFNGNVALHWNMYYESSPELWEILGMGLSGWTAAGLPDQDREGWPLPALPDQRHTGRGQGGSWQAEAGAGRCARGIHMPGEHGNGQAGGRREEAQEGTGTEQAPGPGMAQQGLSGC